MRVTGHLGRGGPHKKVLEREQGSLKFSCVLSIQSDKHARNVSSAAQQGRTRKEASRQHRSMAGGLGAVEKDKAG